MEKSFHYLLMLNYTYFQKSIFEKVKSSGLTMGQPKILDYLSGHDGANQKEIANACNIEPGSLTSILNRMENKELIERKMLNNNRRSYHIYLTEKGKQLQIQVVQSFKQLEKIAFSNFSNEEKIIFINMFEKIYLNMKEGYKKSDKN